jgi:very-short-patch-repair endonuclease
MTQWRVSKIQRTRAKSLRTNMTDAEAKLWRALRAHRFVGHSFRRQAPIGPFIVDFVSYRAMLIVEVDGGQHASNAGDQRRDAFLHARGFQVLRFWNNDVLINAEGVLVAIAEALEEAVA